MNFSSEISGELGTTINNSYSAGHCTIKEGPRSVTITIHVFTLLASLIGNILLITVFMRIREPILLLIANMAASDLLVAVFLIPRLITREIIGSNAFLLHGNGGTFLCKMSTFLSDLSLSVSTQSLVLIAVERFLAIVFPILYKKVTVKMRRVLVASTWIMAVAFHLPYFYTFRLVAADPKNANYQECQSRWDHKSAQLRYITFLYLTVLLIPLLVILVLYIAILINLRSDKMVTYRTDKGARQWKKRNRNLQRMAIATLTAFLICWALFIVISFMKRFSPETIPKCNTSFKILDYISRVLASSYCAFNPCICFIFVRRFSRELKNLCKRKHQKPVIASRKLRGESKLKGGFNLSSRSTCQTGLLRSCSQSSQTISLLVRIDNHHSNVSTPSLAANRPRATF